VAWSAQEEAWICSWLEKSLASPYYNSKINWKLCVKNLKESSEYSLFEKEHVDATKIMECAKRIARRERKSLSDYLKEMKQSR
jgi:hypothetical protein